MGERAINPNFNVLNGHKKMNLLNPYRFNSDAGPVANTFIGGVGAAFITSESDIVSNTTGLVVGDITLFNNDGTNVEFRVEKDYQITSMGSSSMSYYIDSEGWCTALGSAFNANANTKFCYLPNATNFSENGNTWFNSTGLEKINFTGLTNLATRGTLTTNSKLKKLDLRSCALLDQGGSESYVNFQNLTALSRLYIGAMSADDGANGFKSSLINRTLSRGYPSSCKVYYNSAFGVTNRKSFNFIFCLNGGFLVGDKFTFNGNEYSCVSGTPSADGEFQYNNVAATYVNRIVTAINTDTRNTDFTALSYLNNYLIIQADTVGAAFNVACSVNVANTGTITQFAYSSNFVGGNDVHPLLIALRDLQGCTITQVSTPITVNTPTSLNYSNLTSNSVDLDFTEPTANANGTDGYEVWIDDGSAYRKWFEYSEISATGDAISLQEILDDGGSLSGVKIKVRTIDGDMNYSDFSNEITLT